MNNQYDILCGSPDLPETCIFVQRETGVHVRRHTIDSGKGGKPVEIVQITDVHFNLCDKRDMENEELRCTHAHRKWLAEGDSARGIPPAMAYAAKADQTVITGDTLDYLSHGAMKLMDRYIWDADPRILCALGGHELVRQMETGIPDVTSMASRRAIIDAYWRHDTRYISRILGDKAMVIVLDNSESCYREEQIEPLAADLEHARAAGLAVLIFQHEPLWTGDPADTHREAFRVYDPTFYDFRRCIGSPTRDADGATCAVYRMITSFADIIRGIYCGHLHSAFYTEIRCENGSIPQFVLEGNAYDDQAGHVMHITGQ